MKRSTSGSSGSGGTSTLVKGILLGLGGFAAFGIALWLLKYVIVIGVLGGAGYLGYRMVAKNKALGSDESKSHQQLTSGDDDFEKKMRDLEAIERRLDREISGR